MQEIRSSNPYVVTGICDPNKSRVFPTGEDGESPPPAKNLLIPPPTWQNPPHQMFVPFQPKVNPPSPPPPTK